MNIKLPTIRSSGRQPALTESAIPRIRFHLCPSVVKSDSEFCNAFTLIELLIVIAIIAIIAALLFPVVGTAIIHSRLQHATSEMHQLETAIDSYHARYGFYPPGNALASGSNLYPARTNQLYYELCGTTSDSAGSIFTNLDDSGYLPSAKIQQYFGVSGFMNVTKGTGDDAKTAEDFLPGLRPTQIASNGDVFVISTSANSDGGYAPLSGFSTRAGVNVPNPWRYLYPGINNPNSYDLWVQIFAGGKTNLICNWKEQITYNSSLP